MQQNNHEENLKAFTNLISDYYQPLMQKGNFSIFDYGFTNDKIDNSPVYFVKFLLHKRYVFEYRIIEDRGAYLSVILRGIGPAYFGIYDFLEYEDAEMFSLETSEERIIGNLKILDKLIKDNKII